MIQRLLNWLRHRNDVAPPPANFFSIYYVDKTWGWDMNSGLDTNNAFATIAQAASKARPEDIIYVCLGWEQDDSTH